MMDDVATKIKELIRNISDVRRPALFRAVVKEVKEGSDLCTVEIGDLELSDVRLRAIKKDKEKDTLLITPKKGSIVLLADMSDGEMCDLAVVAHSEVVETLLKIEKLEFKTHKKGFFISNNDENLGKIIHDFIEELIKVIVVQGRTPDIPELKNIQKRLAKVLDY